MKRIVLFVEGEGESDAMPGLVGRLLEEQKAWDSVFLDEHTFRVGQVNKLVKNEFYEWKRKLSASMKRPNLGGVLLVLDGDIDRVGSDPFCAAAVARSLTKEAAIVGAGTTYSVATVFALQEFESWLIAGIESLAGKTLPDGRVVAPAGVKAPPGDLEQSPRAAKEWLNKVVEGGYKPTRDQAELTKSVDLRLVRERG